MLAAIRNFGGIGFLKKASKRKVKSKSKFI